VIYLDSSVALAHIFYEPRAPSQEFWRQPIVSSRLLEYEIWTRIHSAKPARRRSGDAKAITDEIEFIEMTPEILARALRPFPIQVRTLDALHLASADYLRRQGETIELASYDKRLLAGARAIGIPICPI